MKLRISWPVLLGFALLMMLCVTGAHSQIPGSTAVSSCGSLTLTSGQIYPNSQDTTGKQCVNASVTTTATITGFTPTASATATLSASGTSADVALPAGTDIVVSSPSTNTVPVFIRMQAGAGTAVATDMPVVPGAAIGFHILTATHISGITAGTAATLQIQGGAGLATGYGGGGGGGGSSGAVFGPTAVGSPAANPPVLMGGTANAGATGNVQVAKVSATGLVSVDGSAVTQPVSAASLPLPTGAATSANQPTNAAQGSTTSGQTGNLIQGAVTTAAPTYTTAQTSPLSLDTAGNLRVNVTAGSSGGTSYAQGSTTSGQNVSPSGCATVSSAPTNTAAQTNMVTCDTGGSLRVNVTSATGVAQGSTTAGQTISPVGGAVTTSAPSYTTGQTSPISLDTAGNTRVNCVTGCSAPVASTMFTLTAAASTNATNIKASAGTVRHISVYNNSATLAWLSFYNTAGTPSCGTSIVWQTMIPANSTSGSGSVEDIASTLNFSTGIGICVATGIAGTGSVAASAYQINIGYN